jgi:hypothetical protein
VGLDILSFWGLTPIHPGVVFSNFKKKFSRKNQISKTMLHYYNNDVEIGKLYLVNTDTLNKITLSANPSWPRDHWPTDGLYLCINLTHRWDSNGRDAGGTCELLGPDGNMYYCDTLYVKSPEETERRNDR